MYKVFDWCRRKSPPGQSEPSSPHTEQLNRVTEYPINGCNQLSPLTSVPRRDQYDEALYAPKLLVFLFPEVLISSSRKAIIDWKITSPSTRAIQFYCSLEWHFTMNELTVSITGTYLDADQKRLPWYDQVIYNLPKDNYFLSIEDE